MVKKISISNIKLFIGYIILVEMVLGGTGNIRNIPIRVTLMFSSVAILFLISIKEDIKYEKGMLISCISLIIFLTVFLCISVIRGFTISKCMEDINSILSVIYVVVFYIIVYKKNYYVNKFINLFVNLTCIVSLITVIIFLLSYLLSFVSFNMVDWLNEFNTKYNYGIITDWLYNGKFARVYLTNGFFMQSALGLVIGNYIFKIGIDIRAFNLKIIILITGIFASSTRGYWLGAIIIIVQLIIFSKGKERKKVLKITGVSIFIGILMLNIFFGGVVDEVYKRFFSVNDFSSDISNYIRKVQVDCLIDGISKKPALGWGLGTNINGYSEIINRSGRYVEIYYLDMIYRIGLVGFLGLIIFLLLIYKRFFRIIKSKYITYEDKNLSIVFICILNSAIVINVTNPYFRGTNGIFIIYFTVIILNSIFSKIRINQERNE